MNCGPDTPAKQQIHTLCATCTYITLNCKHFPLLTNNKYTIVMGWWLVVCSCNSWEFCVSLSLFYRLGLIHSPFCLAFSFVVIIIISLWAVCCIWRIKTVELRHTIPWFFSVSHLLVPKFVMSALLLKCTKHMGCNSDVKWRICVRTEGRWAKEIRWEGVSQAVVKIVMNWCVL